MISLLSRIFGGPGAASSVVETGLNLIDKAFYTKEEQSEQQLKAKEQASQQVIAWLQATQGSNIARRLIALTIVFTWFFLWVSSVALRIASIFFKDPDLHARVAEAATVLQESAGDITPELMLVLGFYFAVRHLGDFVKPLVNKISGDKK